MRRERPDLAALDRDGRKLVRDLERRYRRRATIRLEQIIDRAVDRHNRRWDAVRREAQRLQDSGYFAPRVRIAKNKQNAQNVVLGQAERRKSTLFEDQFQRLKRAQERRHA